MTEALSPPPRRRGRPRVSPDASETRARLIRAGLEHLTERGYSAVGLEEILTAACLPKGAFYHWFASKAAFGEALIEAYDSYFLALLDRALGDPSRPPLARLRGFVEAAEAGMARHDFRRGCLVGNLGQEMNALPESFRARLIAALEGWEARTARCLAEAQAARDIRHDIDPAAEAARFWIGWEGAVLRAKLERRPEPLRVFAAGFFHTLDR